MMFKSLLFAEKASERVINPDVISDLKLDLILPSAVTDVLLYKADRESLNLRREMFKKLLKKESSAELVEKMTESLSLASRLYSALNSADSAAASSFIFVHLFRAVSDFCQKAIVISDAGELYARFTDAVKSLCESETFKKAEGEAEELCGELAKINEIIIATENESSKIMRESERCIFERLRECAKELGIPLNEKKEAPIALQKSIAEALSRLYPEELKRAEGFYDSYRMLVRGEMFDYLCELEFILGVLRFTREAEASGIPYSFPSVSDKKEIALKGVYDVTLLKKGDVRIVPNDACFNESEPFFYLTGANGGGKTTYIRALGCAMLLFLAGAPVFCEGGQASLVSGVFTHFPRDERFEGSGRFIDEVNRVNAILDRNDGNALILLNETYSTTGEEKAVEYTDALMKELCKSGSFGVYITHQHGVDESEVPFLSVVVDESDANRRTYKIEKRRSESFSYAKDILKKHGLTAESLRKRFGLEKI